MQSLGRRFRRHSQANVRLQISDLLHIYLSIILYMFAQNYLLALHICVIHSFAKPLLHFCVCHYYYGRFKKKTNPKMYTPSTSMSPNYYCFMVCFEEADYCLKNCF